MQAQRQFLIVTPKDALCPVKEAVKIIGRKWYLVIIYELMDRPLGFNELKKACGGISSKILSQSLSDLEGRGLVLREVKSTSPVRVSYSLTTQGADLQRVFAEIKSWGESWDLCAKGATPTPGTN